MNRLWCPVVLLATSCLPLPELGLGDEREGERDTEGEGSEGEGEGGEGGEGEGEGGEGGEGEGEGGEGEGPRCGDGTIDAGEVCDDGNPSDGDGCNIDCAPSGRRLLTTTMSNAFTTYNVDLGRAAVSHDVVAVAADRLGDTHGDRVVLTSLLDEHTEEVLLDSVHDIVRDIVAVDDGFLIVTSDFDERSEHIFHVALDGTRSPRLDVPREVFSSRVIDEGRLVAVRDGAVVVESATGTTVVGVHSRSALSPRTSGGDVVVASVDDNSSTVQLTRLGANSAQGTVGLPGGDGYPLTVSADDFGHVLVEYNDGSAFSTELRLYGDDNEVLGAVTLEDDAVAALTGDGTGDVIIVTAAGSSVTTERLASDLVTRRWRDQLTIDGDTSVEVDTVGSAPDGRVVVVVDFTTLVGNNLQTSFSVRVLAP